MHRTLARQLKKSGLKYDGVTKEKLIAFYKLVNQAYIDNDEDRLLQEHILDTSSKEMQDLYNTLKCSTERDNLTGILNRKSFKDSLIRKISENRNQPNNINICSIDIDHFKNINDTLGYDTGDALLTVLTHRLNDLLQEGDLFARLGGDEFAIAFCDLEKAQFNRKVDQLMTIIRQNWQVKKSKINITASIGISSFPKDDSSYKGLMKKSDLAIYQAKSLGRDQYVIYSDSLDKMHQERLFIEKSMPTALINKEFELYFQPIVDLQKNKIIGAESLIRWNNPEKGLVFPDRFISLAESTGFINILGEWVIKEACMMIKRLNPMDNEFRLSVNVSISQFQSGDIYSSIKDAIYSSGINPKNFAIEITESIMCKDIDNIIRKINKIKTLGVSIYLDDFGTGFSSLSYLSQLDIDVIKIDKMFLDALIESGSKSKLLDTIIAMGDVLDKKVIAEGVENDHQRKYIQEKGCDFYQGYLFSKPMIEADFVDLFKNNIKPKISAAS